MNKSVFKTIIAGVFIGTLVFFVGPLLLLVFLLKFIFTPFGRARMGWYGHPRMMGAQRFAFADKIRTMSDEEFASFKSNFQQGFNGGCHQQ